MTSRARYAIGRPRAQRALSRGRDSGVACGRHRPGPPPAEPGPRPSRGRPTMVTLSASPGGERRPPTSSDLLVLALLPRLTPAAIRTLAARGPLAALLSDPEPHADLLDDEMRRRIRNGEARRRAEEERTRAHALGVRIVDGTDADFPILLGRIFDPPPVLYVRGRLLAAEGETSVAIVGARAATPGGVSLARAMARDLASSGATVVAGLARGIDTAAHLGALDAGGRTVAVLGCGIDRVYPPENVGLARAIERAGAIVSEFPLGTPPLPMH